MPRSRRRRAAESQKANLDALNVGLDDEDMQGDRGAAERQALRQSRLRAGVGLGKNRHQCSRRNQPMRLRVRWPSTSEDRGNAARLEPEAMTCAWTENGPSRGHFCVMPQYCVTMLDDHHPVGVVMAPAFVPAVIAMLAEFGARAVA